MDFNSVFLGRFGRFAGFLIFLSLFAQYINDFSPRKRQKTGLTPGGFTGITHFLKMVKYYSAPIKDKMFLKREGGNSGIAHFLQWLNTNVPPNKTKVKNYI